MRACAEKCGVCLRAAWFMRRRITRRMYVGMPMPV